MTNNNVVDIKQLIFYKNPDNNWEDIKINIKKDKKPKDWIIKQNKECIKRNKKGNYSPKNNVSNGTIPLYNCSQYQTLYVNKPTSNKESILLSTGGLPAIHYTNGEHAYTTDVLSIDITSSINTKYYYYYFKNNFNLLNRTFQGTGLKHLSKPLYEKIKFILPSTLLEQDKIASILSFQETLINKKKRYLEETKRQRKYFQQEMLSGRLRIQLNQKAINEAKQLKLIETKFIIIDDKIEIKVLEIIENKKEEFEKWINIDFANKVEFYWNSKKNWKEVKLSPRKVKIPMDWTTNKIDNIFNINRGKVISKEYIKNNPGIYPVYSSATLNNGCIGKINTYTENYECVTWTTDGYAGKLNYRKGKFNVTNICGILKPKYNNINLYLFSLIAQKEVYLMRATTYSNSKVMSNHIKKVKFILPPTLLEQTLISTKLTKLDNLIDKLEKEIEEIYQKQFKYFQQELLSGRLRVK